MRTAADHGKPMRVLEAVESVNGAQKRVLGDKVVRRFGDDLTGRTFAVWGLAFKPNTDDMREAPSRVLARELVSRGASLRMHDPVSMAEARRVAGCRPGRPALAVNVLMQAGPAAARHAILQQLVDKIGETCNLTMLSGDDVVYLDRVETQWPLRMHLQPGSRVPLHCTASGKLLLAFLPSAQRQRLVASLPLRAHSAHTITNAEALHAELAETRRRRLGVNNQENLEGMIAVAVPVMRNRNRACARLPCRCRWRA